MLGGLAVGVGEHVVALVLRVGRGRREPDVADQVLGPDLLDHRDVVHAVGAEELGEGPGLQRVADDADARAAVIGEERHRLRLALRERGDLRAVGGLVRLVHLARGDLAAEGLELLGEDLGDAGVVVVVGVGDGDPLEALLADQPGQRRALVGVGGRGAEHQVVVVELGDRGRSGRVRDRDHPRRDRHRLHHAVGRARARGADHGHHLLDAHHLLAGVHRGLRVALAVGQDQRHVAPVQEAALGVDVARREVPPGGDGRHQLGDRAGHAGDRAHLHLLRRRRRRDQRGQRGCRQYLLHRFSSLCSPFARPGRPRPGLWDEASAGPPAESPPDASAG